MREATNCRTARGRLLFCPAKFPQNHTIFEEKTKRKGEEGTEERKKYRFMYPHSKVWFNTPKLAPRRLFRLDG
jgi:hypothetical protein